METFSALLAICAGNSPAPVNFPHKGQWRGALMFALICVWINAWVNNRKAGDLRRYCAHYDVIVMLLPHLSGAKEFTPQVPWELTVSRRSYFFIMPPGLKIASESPTTEIMSRFIVTPVSADRQAPIGVKISSDTVVIKFGSCTRECFVIQFSRKNVYVDIRCVTYVGL